MTALVFEAIKTCGIRALVSQGWGGLRGGETSENIFMLGDCPHDWLFERVSCVVHHGGAGTTAAGIKAGKPTVVIPFFGDQPFWGAMIARAGAGPQPIPYKQLTAEKLVSAIKEAMQPLTASRAAELGAKIQQETGAANGVTCFHEMLPIDQMRCMITAERVAVWRLSKTDIRLSAMVAFLLVDEGLIDPEKLKL
jgi:UDP:flavonoid glycosyltransferase YjiC (YdhE family)